MKPHPRSAFHNTKKIAGHKKFSVVIDDSQLDKAKRLYPELRSRNELFRMALDYLLKHQPRLVAADPCFVDDKR